MKKCGRENRIKGFIYFVNRVTGDTVWENLAVGTKKGKNNVWDNWAENGLDPSQQIWESYTDEVSGHEYYHNPLTGKYLSNAGRSDRSLEYA